MGMNYSNQETKERALANLTHEGRPPKWDEAKHRHNVSLTDEAWSLLQQKADLNNLSVSELLEYIARDYSLHRPRRRGT